MCTSKKKKKEKGSRDSYLQLKFCLVTKQLKALPLDLHVKSLHQEAHIL